MQKQTKSKPHHKTADMILETALRLFVKKGFDGTSINDIANLAGINKSLIYHHFSNKESLWRHVKEGLLKKALPQPLDAIQFSTASLRSFLEDFITLRFKIYDETPDLARIIAWQRLEPQEQITTAESHYKSLLEIQPYIKELKNKGAVRLDLSEPMIQYLILELSTAFFMNPPRFISRPPQKEEKETFLKNLVDFIAQGLEASP